MKDSFWPRLCSVALIDINTAMSSAIVQSTYPVTLIGAGRVGRAALADALSLAPHVVAADGGANMAVRAGLVPEAVIGDLDSVAAATRAALPAARFHRSSSP